MRSKIPEDWRKIKLGTILTESRIPLADDDPAKRISVKLHLQGVQKRDERATDTVGSTVHFKRLAGQLIYGKQNLHNGAIGIVPKELDGFGSSQDIPAFDVAKEFSVDWIFQYISRKEYYRGLERICSGTGSKRVQPKALFEEEVLSPPLPEQQKIASILSSVDDVIKKTRAQIDKLKDLKTGMMQELLAKGIGHTAFKDSPVGWIPEGWGVSGICDCCEEVFLGLTAKVDYVEDDGVYLVRAADITGGVLRFDNARQISYEQHKSLTKYRKARRGDVLVSKSGSLGVCAIVETDVEFSIYESIIVLQPKSALLHSNFLLWLMRSTETQTRLLGGTVGSTVGHLNLGDFRKLLIPVPSFPEQEAIGRALGSLNRKFSSLQSRLEKLLLLKKSLMQDLLTGKVRINVDNKENAVA